MQNPDYMTPSRSNNLLGAQKITLPHPVHIFTHPQTYSPLMTAIKSQFTKKNIKIEQHHNPNQLNILTKKTSQKLFIIIDTLKPFNQSSNTVFSQKFTFPKIKDEIKIKIITIPNKIPKTDYQNIMSPIDIIAAYQKFYFVHQSAKIKLRKVHSSKDVKYQLASPQKISTIKKSSKEIFFQKLLYNDFKVNGDSDFKILTDSIKTLPNTYEVMSYNELKKIVEGMKDNKGSKVLLLLDDKILKQYRQFIEKNKLSQRVQIIVYGQLRPNKELLRQNVYFASDNAENILTQLQKLKFQRISQCRTQYLKLSSAKKNRFIFSQQSLKNMPPIDATYNNPPWLENNTQMNIYSSTPKKIQQKPQLHRFSDRSGASLYSNASSQVDRFMRTWIVDVDPKQNNRRNAQYLTMQQGKTRIQGPAQPISKRASRITALRRNSSQSSQSNYTNTLNNLVDQAMRIRKSQGSSNSNVNIMIPHQIQVHKMHNSQKQMSLQQSPITIRQSSPQPSIQRPQSPPSNRKVLTITKKLPSQHKHKTKHQRMPSKVIQQTSQQYRGSNRESIVNMDDYFYHQATINLGEQQQRGSNINLLANGNFSKMKNYNVNNNGSNQQQQYVQSVDSGNGGLMNRVSNNYIVSQKNMVMVNENKTNTVMVREQVKQVNNNNNNTNNNNNNTNNNNNNTNNNNNNTNNNNNNTNNNNNNTTSLKAKNTQQLPLQSPQHSQIHIKQKLIDSPTGQLGTYNGIPQQNNNQNNININSTSQSKSTTNYDKKIFQTITVTPYQPTQSKSQRQLGYQKWTKENVFEGQTYIIDGKTGQLIGQSQKRMNQIKIKSITLLQQQQQSTQHKQQSSTQHQYQIIKPLNHIQPEIVKISSSSYSIDNQNFQSRQSIPTQRKIHNIVSYNNNHNTGGSRQVISNDGGSVTSIREMANYHSTGITQNNPRDLGYENRNYTTSAVVTNNNNNGISARNLGYQTVSNNDQQSIQRYDSSRIERIQRVHSPSTTVSYNNNYSSSSVTKVTSPSNNAYTVSSSSNYKVYTPEEYAAKYGTHAANTVLSPGRKDYNTHTPTIKTNPYTYSNNANNNTNQYSYSSTTSNKQPQVINRVYIKASDLPQRTEIVGGGTYTGSSTFTKRIQPTIPVQKSQQYFSPKLQIHQVKPHKYILQQHGPKLTVDEDPFLQKASKVSQRRGSYMKRKQDGKRDPFSPYEQAGSYIQKQSVLNKQKSAVKLNVQSQYKSQRVALTKTESKMIIQPPSRDNYHQQSSKMIAASGVTRYEPSGRNYANSPTRREGSSYEKGLNSENPLKRPSHQSIDVKNILPLKDSNIKPLVYDSRSPMKVSEYKSVEPQKQKTAYTYSSPTRHVYERKQVSQPRVQKSNFNTRIPNQKKNQLKESLINKVDQKSNKLKGHQNEIGQISKIHNRNSEVFQVSDGSIMRRNNIRFGVNKQNPLTNNNQNDHQNSLQYLDDIKSQIQISRINRTSQIKQGQYYTLQKKYAGQKDISDEKEAYSYINTSINEFYFLVDEDLPHIYLWLTKYLKTSNDTIQKYRGMEELYEKLKIQKQQQSYDVTLIFTKKQDLHKVNRKTLYEDSYLVEVLGDEYKGLQISQKDHRVRLGKLPYLKLVQKVIVETLLTHVILYQKTMENTQNSQSYFSKQVAHILSLFPQGHFIKEPYAPPLTAKHITSLIDDPKFTRIYIICNQKEMAHVSDQLQTTSTQSLIPREIFKLICIPSDNEILKYESKIESHPKVAWMTNASKIGDYKSLIKYAMKQQQDEQMYNGKIENQEKQKIFYHIRHKNIVSIIQKEFPLRFEFDSYASINEVQRKIIKSKADLKVKQNGMKVKQSMSPMSKRSIVQNKSKNSISINQTIVNYLILHPVSTDEYVDTKMFKKVFLLGKSQKTQRKVVKVSTNQELLELLKK